jgi:hypothetical protein
LASVSDERSPGRITADQRPPGDCSRIAIAVVRRLRDTGYGQFRHEEIACDDHAMWTPEYEPYLPA